MSNYVYNRVTCSKNFFKKYFYDTNPFGDKEIDNYVKEHPYITFNKLFGLNSLNEYMEKYGTYIYYGYGHIYKDIGNDVIEVKFKTRWYYPIYAIIKSIELEHDIIWYACEECVAHISKFSWKDNKVIEEVAVPDDIFYDWYYENEDKYEELDDADDLLWYYNLEKRLNWKICEDNDLIKKYEEKK